MTDALAPAEPRERLEITALGHEGDGIAETPAGRVYVPFALPGETVTVAGTGEHRALRSVDIPGPDRIDPACRHFGSCGGCALQHISAPALAEWKREQVAAAFASRGLETDIRPVADIAAGDRRRAVFSALGVAKGAVLGFSRRASNEILPITECPVLAPGITAKLDLFRTLANRLFPQGRRGRIAVTLADNGLDIAVEAGRKLDRGLLESLSRLAADPAVARLTVDGDMIANARRPEIAIEGGLIFPPPGGFLQASPAAEKALMAAVVEAVGDARKVADLFAGIGTFTLGLARKRPVLAVEGDQPAVAALDEAVRKARGLKPVTSRRRDLFRNPLAAIELKDFDAVVFDPPRAGARAQAEKLAESKVARIAAVSCNPATLARDARILVDGGYRLSFVQPVDQFVWSPHIEAVAGFVREKA